VRRIEVFAATHVFGNIMILITIIYVFVEAGLDIKNQGGFKLGGGIAPISSRWGQAIGLSVYSYEGIGVVLPIMEVTKDQSQYPKIVIGVILTVAALYISFGLFTCSVWGEGTFDLITKNVDKEPTAPAGLNYTIKVLFMTNLLFSYPLVLYPTHLIVEKNLFYNWDKTKKR
jgi:proton-coupled amino acid transporter